MPSVEAVADAHRDVISRFGLTFEPGGAVGPSWFVMVRCGIPNPDAYELNDALRKLEREVEAKSGLDVTLMLTNTPAALNGKH